ncbi:MAG: hypothetical protein MJE77_29905 [Proteobacteria bacterium]|nr:hypothetical protein [Pseudomonadota bacterium]
MSTATTSHREKSSHGCKARRFDVWRSRRLQATARCDSDSLATKSPQNILSRNTLTAGKLVRSSLQRRMQSSPIRIIEIITILHGTR